MVINAVVVDDDAPSASGIAKLLEQAGCKVSTCTDAESAIALALDPAVDLVSLDIRMPRFNGFELLSLIRSHEHSRRAPSVPIIAITGNVTIEDKAQAIAAGFAAHLAKPVLLDDLRYMLGNVQRLRADMYRTRYSVDREAVADRLDHLLASHRDDAWKALTGLALAMEQQGADLLQTMLLNAYRRDAQAAAEAATRLAEVGEAIGASHFAALCAAAIQALDHGLPSFERQAVLARAELDRLIYTLRERVLP